MNQVETAECLVVCNRLPQLQPAVDGRAVPAGGGG